MGSINQIKLGAIISYIVVIFNIIAGLLYTPWMISQIGKVDYGLYILVTTFLAYFVVDYGMWMSINKLLSQYRAQSDTKKIKQTISVATKIYLSIDVVILIVISIVYLNIENIFSTLTVDELDKFKTIFLIAGISSVLNFPFAFVRGIMYSHEYIIQSRLFELGAKIGLIATTVIALLLHGGLYWLVIVYATTPLIKNIAISIFLYKKGIRFDLRSWNPQIVKSIFSISVWLLFVVIAELFINNISPTIITIRSSIEEVAVFSAGLTIFGYVYSISSSVSGLFLPAVEKIKYSGSTNDLHNYTIKVGRIQLLISGFIIFGVFVTGSLFYNAWLGSSFSDSYFVASLLLIPRLIVYSQQIEGTLLFSENKLFYKSILMTLTAISSVSLSYILTPKYGAIGAAIAISVSNLIFMCICMNVVYVKVLNFEIKSFLKMIIKFISLFILIGVGTKLIQLYVLNSYIELCNIWLQFISVALVYAALFVSSVWVLLLNQFEKDLIRGIVTKALTIIKR